MKITVINGGQAADICDITLSRHQNLTQFTIYTRELNPFGKLFQQGQNYLWVSYRTGSQTTAIKFEPESDTDRVLMRQQIVLSPDKRYLPERGRRQGQWAQRIYCITEPQSAPEISQGFIIKSGGIG